MASISPPISTLTWPDSDALLAARQLFFLVSDIVTWAPAVVFGSVAFMPMPPTAGENDAMGQTLPPVAGAGLSNGNQDIVSTMCPSAMSRNHSIENALYTWSTGWRAPSSSSSYSSQHNKRRWYRPPVSSSRTRAGMSSHRSAQVTVNSLHGAACTPKPTWQPPRCELHPQLDLPNHEETLRPRQTACRISELIQNGNG